MAFEEVEIWKKINEFNYSVSNLGRVRNDKTGRFNKPSSNGHGYMHLALHEYGVAFDRYVHILVAQAFLGLPTKEAPEVNHKDSDKSNNKLTNLEYSSRIDNAYHAVRNNLYRSGAQHYKTNLTQEQVNIIRESTKLQRELAIEFNVKQSTISRIQTGIRWPKS